MKTLIPAAALALALSFTPHVGAESGRYALEGFLGKADQNNHLAGFPSLSGTDTARGLRLSAMLSQAIALELGYGNYGTAEDQERDAFGDLITDSLDTRAALVGLKGRLPLGHRVALVGRAGLAFWELDYRQTDSAFPGDSFTDSDEGTNAYFGAGLQVQLEENIHLGLDYNQLDFDAVLGAAGTEHEVSSFAVSLGVSF